MTITHVCIHLSSGGRTCKLFTFIFTFTFASLGRHRAVHQHKARVTGTGGTMVDTMSVVRGRDKSCPLLLKVSGSIPRAPLGFEHNCT